LITSRRKLSFSTFVATRFVIIKTGDEFKIIEERERFFICETEGRNRERFIAFTRGGHLSDKRNKFQHLSKEHWL